MCIYGVYMVYSSIYGCIYMYKGCIKGLIMRVHTDLTIHRTTRPGGAGGEFNTFHGGDKLEVGLSVDAVYSGLAHLCVAEGHRGGRF